MHSSSRAIVLRVTPHSDKASVCVLYTEERGRVEALVRLSRTSRTAAVPKGLLSPLALLDVNLFQRHQSEIPTITSAVLSYAAPRTVSDPYRQCLSLYLSEVLFRSIREPLMDSELFAFLEETIRALETTDQLGNFHLVFLYRLAGYLGFAPNLSGQGVYFDMESGQLASVCPYHPHYMDGTQLAAFCQLSRLGYAESGVLSLSRDARAVLLSRMEDYFQLHVSDFHGTHSREVLSSLFD